MSNGVYAWNCESCETFAAQVLTSTRSYKCAACAERDGDTVIGRA